MNYLLRLMQTGLLSVILLSCLAQPKTSLSADEFEKEITTKENIQILDVRTAGEFFSGHIKNALLADWTDSKEFERRIAFIDKNKSVYVYCLSGGRSAAAAAKLRKTGYENVYELRGGTNAWKAAGKPLEGNSNEKGMSVDEFNKAINSSKTVLVDFGAEWCPPCRKMEPVLKSLTTNNPGKFTLVKVDGGSDQAVLQQYKVTALPVFIIFKDGKQVWRKDGMVDEKELAEQIK
ncbi:MAG: thioredoxin fold domain-containing protein [Chitinophagaceae bacterium]|nr:thioredoxin fold domain-containing protein [Chitinophagaceae bacterium]